MGVVGLVRISGGEGAIGANIVDMDCRGVGGEEEGLGGQGMDDGGWVNGRTFSFQIITVR